jgi:hypothetical protein
MPKDFKPLVALHKNENGDILSAKTVSANYELSDFVSDIRTDLRAGDWIEFVSAGRRPYENEDDPEFVEVDKAPTIVPMQPADTSAPAEDDLTF